VGVLDTTQLEHLLDFPSKKHLSHQTLQQNRLHIESIFSLVSFKPLCLIKIKYNNLAGEAWNIITQEPRELITHTKPPFAGFQVHKIEENKPNNGV
jgi:hypothetical protein